MERLLEGMTTTQKSMVMAIAAGLCGDTPGTCMDVICLCSLDVGLLCLLVPAVSTAKKTVKRRGPVTHRGPAPPKTRPGWQELSEFKTPPPPAEKIPRLGGNANASKYRVEPPLYMMKNSVKLIF